MSDKTWKDIKVGDKVRVRTLKSVLCEFPYNITPDGDCKLGSFYARSMEGFAGFVVEIAYVGSKYHDTQELSRFV